MDGERPGRDLVPQSGATSGVVPSGARLLAVVALVAGVGFVVAVALFLARNGWYVVLGLAGVVVSVVGGWWVVTGGTVRRLVGGAAVLVRQL